MWPLPGSVLAGITAQRLGLRRYLDAEITMVLPSASNRFQLALDPTGPISIADRADLVSAMTCAISVSARWIGRQTGCVQLLFAVRSIDFCAEILLPCGACHPHQPPPSTLALGRLRARRRIDEAANHSQEPTGSVADEAILPRLYT